MQTPDAASNIILKVQGLYKKFPKDLRSNMIYGIQDFFKILFHLPLKTDQLRKGEFWSLSNINFELKKGEILTIVGVNGSGKTTLMRLVAGIYQADKGQIIFPQYRRVTSLFALKTGMHPLFTGRENVYVKGSMYGMTKEEIDDKMEFIIDFSELGDFMDMPFGNYSSGMSARLAFAIAIATDPELLILDEALAVGDFVFRSKCFAYIEEYVQQANKSVLIVTNNPNKVKNMASRMLILHKGKQIFESTVIKDALEFFILNCAEGMSEKRKQKMLKNIHKFKG